MSVVASSTDNTAAASVFGGSNEDMAARGQNDDASRPKSANSAASASGISVGARVTGTTTSSSDCPSSPNPNTAGTTSPPVVVTATKSPRPSRSSSRYDHGQAAAAPLLSPRPSSILGKSPTSRNTNGNDNKASPLSRYVTFSPRPDDVKVYGSPVRTKKDMPLTGGIKSASSPSTASRKSSRTSPRRSASIGSPPRRSLDVSPRRSRALHGFSRISPRRKAAATAKSNKSTNKSIGLVVPLGSSITGSPRLTSQNAGGGGTVTVSSFTGSPTRSSASRKGEEGGQELPTFAALGSPDNLLPASAASTDDYDASSNTTNGGSTKNDPSNEGSNESRPVIIATTGAAAATTAISSPRPTLTAASISSRAANLGSAQRYRIVASPGRQDAVLALSALCGAGKKTVVGGGGGVGAGGRPRKISMGGGEEQNSPTATSTDAVVRTGDPPAIISCDTSSTTGSSSHLIARTPQQGMTLSSSPIDDSDGKLKLFMEATREIRSKDLLKSPRPTSAATTPNSGNSCSNSPRPPRQSRDGKRTPGITTKGGNKTSSRAAVTPLPTLPVDSQVTPASLAEQHQRDKFYAFYYQQQYYQQHQQQPYASPHSGHYSPYYQYGGYWPQYDYGGAGAYGKGPAVATAISTKTKRRTKGGGSMGRIPNSPIPRPPDVIAAKIQSAVKLSKKRSGGNDVISQDIMDAGISEDKSSARISARAGKKAKLEASSSFASDTETKKAGAKKVSPKKRAKTKRSSPPPKSSAAKSKAKAKAKAKSKSKTAAAAAAKAGPQAGEKGYKRADKSLGLLCERFVDHYKNSHGVEIAVDDAAADLAVERRRIYDIINILEALRVVRRICKNTYTWHGSEVLPLIFASMQQDAIVKWQDQAAANGLADASSLKKRSRSNSCATETGGKSMAALTCDFVKLFLAGDSTITVTEAADRVLGTNSEVYTERNVETAEQKAEAKAMKSKIRRLYDIANVLTSISVIVKENCGASFQKNSESVPQFRWIYAIPPKAFLRVLKDHGHLIPADPADADPVISIASYVSKEHKSKRKKSKGKSLNRVPHSASKKSSKAKKTKN